MRRTAGIIFVEVAFAVALAVAPMIVPSIEPSTGYILLSACLLLAALGGMLYFWPQKRELERVLGLGDSYNNSGNNFGHMGPINVGRQQFEMTEAVMSEVLNKTHGWAPFGIATLGGNPKSAQMADALQPIFQHAEEMRGEQVAWE